MSCSTCGSTNQNCGCAVAQSCKSGQPFFTCTPVCPEDHCQSVIVPQLATAVKSENQLNMPNCGELAVILISNLIAVHIGSYLWSDAFGYLEITDFDLTSGRITIRNNCNTGNAAPGTEIPVCSTFVVTDPPEVGASGQSDLFPFVAIDFTAPAVSTCLTITVTTVNGLVVGKTVQIGTGIYRIDSISSPTTIDICNDGSGITPGTPVIAKNAAGEFQFPIVLIDSNVCTNPLVVQGTLLACASGVASPLTGAVVPSVPVLIDAVTGEVQFQVLSNPTIVCTTLSCDLSISIGVVDYTLEVVDSSQFTVGRFIQLGTRIDRFQITALPSPTTIDVTRTSTPVANEVVPEDTSVCELECCEQLFEQFGGDLTPCSDFEDARFTAQEISDQVKLLLDDLNTEIETDDTTNEILVSNGSECRGMSVLYAVYGRAFGAFSNSGSSVQVELAGVLNTVIDSVPNQVLVNDTSPYETGGNIVPYSLLTGPWIDHVTITAGTSKLISGKYKVTLTDNGGNPEYDLISGAGGIDCVVTLIGIAVGV